MGERADGRADGWANGRMGSLLLEERVGGRFTSGGAGRRVGNPARRASGKAGRCMGGRSVNRQVSRLEGGCAHGGFYYKLLIPCCLHSSCLYTVQCM